MTDDKQDDTTQEQPLDLTKQAKAEPDKVEAPEQTEAEIAAEIADEARAAADDAEEAAAEAEADAVAVTAEEASKALAAAGKELERAVKARDKLNVKITELEAAHVAAGKALDIASPEPTFEQNIQSVLKSQNDARRASEAKPAPIDQVGLVGPTPFQR